MSAGTLNLRWLVTHPQEVARRRLYYYPYGRWVGPLNDEVDFAHLPDVLQQGMVDLLGTTHSYTHAWVAARARWAQRAVPVTGMLHAIHSAALASDVILQLTDGVSLPCDAFISPTICGARAHARLLEAAREHLAQSMPEPPSFVGTYHVIPYGIDALPFVDLHKQACRQALGVDGQAPVVLSLGRFLRHEKADLMPLLLAWRDVIGAHPQALLLLAGSHDRGTYAEQLKDLAQQLGIANHVIFHENVSLQDKHRLYGAADIFVSLSDNLQETYGLTVLEAMAAGLPVVASGWNGYQETVRHGITGLLLPTFAAANTESDQALLQRLAEGVMEGRPSRCARERGDRSARPCAASPRLDPTTRAALPHGRCGEAYLPWRIRPAHPSAAHGGVVCRTDCHGTSHALVCSEQTAALPRRYHAPFRPLRP